MKGGGGGRGGWGGGGGAGGPPAPPRAPGLAGAAVPEVLPELFALVEKKGGHRLEGIFRLSAAKEKTDDLVSVIDQAGDDPSTAAVLESCGPSVVATALKQWLGALPQPLFPFAVYDEAIAAHSDADAARAICLRLPPAHQCLLADLYGDGVADLARFPHPDLRCDHVKRRLVDQRRYEVTSDRHIVWT